jgi:hypothetical protein
VTYARRFLVATALACAAALPAPAAAPPAQLLAAGNAGDESTRLALLRELATHAETKSDVLDAATRAELAALLPIVASWAEGRERARADLASAAPRETHRYLHDFFNNATRPFSPAFPTPPREASPLYPLWALYRGRFLAWYLIEHSDASRVPERRKRFIEEAERCFSVARAAFPANPLLPIYAGENVAASDLAVPDERAPAWANAQRRALEQLHKIIRWWIAERQLPNGEFGGNWGDDVEMWRWWAPILIGFDDPVINAAQARLAAGNLARPTLAAGYTSHLTDVEHTAEETADTLTPMLHALGPDPAWTPRIKKLLTLADRTWWGENARGRLQFKHIDFNHERLGADAGRGYDTAYHTRVLQPAFLLWQRTDDPALARPLLHWLNTWLEAALSSERGKPAGVVPAALHWPSGKVGSDAHGWVGPDLGGDPMVGLYSFPHRPVAVLTAAFLQAHVQTRDPRFLEPLLKMAELRRAHLRSQAGDGPPGSVAWTAHRLPAVINDALAKWRQLTGDARFDDLLLADANGYVQHLLGRDTRALTAELAATAKTLSYNWPMFTDEVRYTDRVLSFPHAWPRTVATGLARIDAALLYSTVTGDPGAVDAFPLNGVRWHTVPRDLAVLVRENRRERFGAEVYAFGTTARSLEVTLHTLEPGTYTWQLATPRGDRLAEGRLTLTPTARRASFTFPPRTAVLLSVTSAPSP